MSKPATEARLAAAANGFTQVLARGNAHIITKNPTTGKCAYDGQVGGGWHYGEGLETDTAWEADSDSNYLRMVKAGYNLRARKLFNAGDLIQWTDPVSGQYVKFQPQNFQWIDGTTGSNSLISVAQAVASPSVDDDKLYWANAFGAGRHFRYTAAPTRLIKHLIIDSAANLPACPTWITNPWLELTFTLTPSSGVTMYVDGVAWNRAKSKTTANAIEFRLPSGQVVWSMAAPLAYDSSEMGEPCNGQIKLYVNKKIKYCSVRFPKSWIDTAVFPIVIDPAVDYQVSGTGDDGCWDTSYFWNNDTRNYIGFLDSAISNVFARWTGVTIPAGATIDVAYVSVYREGSSGTPAACKMYFNDVNAPTAPTTLATAKAKVKTTAYANWTPPTSGTWVNSPSAVDIITELIGSYDYSAGAAMMMLWIGAGKGTVKYMYFTDYTGNTTRAPKLHIEYTEAASGKPFYAYAQQ